MLPTPAGEEMPEWLSQRARLSPDVPALIFGEQQWTFAELDRRVARVAGALASSGVRENERVALLARNSAEFVVAAHAVPRLGAMLAPLNTRWTAGELRSLLEDARASVLLYDQPNDANAQDLAGAVAGLRVLPIASLQQDDVGTPNGDPKRVSLSLVHSVIYTSGTTGRPKGAMLTWGNHWWSAVGSALNLGLRDDDRWLACMPLFHVGGLAILLRNVIYGTPVVLHDGFDADAVSRDIDEHGVTIVSLVPTMLSRLLEARGARPFPEGFRCVLLGGGPIPDALLEECARRDVPVAPTYGLTEAASQVATLAPGTRSPRSGTAGRPLFTTEIRIVDEGDVAIAVGEEGEIVVRGPTVTPGYLDRPEETARALRGGWLHTGDRGLLDEDGYLFVLGRREDLIVSGGENVSANEVEQALLAHPDVSDAGVVGVPDEEWGERVAATVVLREGASTDADELREFCRGRVAAYKVAALIRFTDVLPRNAAGKLLRRTLRDQWARASQQA